MHIVVEIDSGASFEMEISNDMVVEDFQALVATYCEIDPVDQVINSTGVNFTRNVPLSECGVQDGARLFVSRRKEVELPKINWGSIQVPKRHGHAHRAIATHRTSRGTPDSKQLMHLLKADPYQLSILKQNNPDLGHAVEAGDEEKFDSILKLQREEKERADAERIRLYRLAEENPFDAELQRKIEEDIRLQNVTANMELAMEHSPESFGSVHMLYIDCEVNGYHVKAFVDSGAQTTIMNETCAMKCGIMRLVDTRFSGIAQGVGQAKIIGRVHAATIRIASTHLTCSFTVLEQQSVDMLLGLDMLKRHQCCIDLRANVLRIGTTGNETPFLSEADLPDHHRTHHRTSSPPQSPAPLLTSTDGRPAVSGQATLVAAGAPGAGGASGVQAMPEVDDAMAALMGLGFSRARVAEALHVCGGNVDAAAQYLFETNN
jgi:DNA damage-inducible protein 1